MLTGVFTKSLRDRWVSILVASAALGLYLLLAMAMYREIDLSIYADLPEGVRELFGIGSVSGVGQLALGAVYGFFAALTLSGVAISIGSSAIAGEERDGTMSTLLGNPESRTRLLASKAAGLVSLVTVGAILLWAAATLAPQLLSVSTAGLHIGALMIHMLAIALFFGLLALAIGAWTGSTGSASGYSAGLLIVSYFAAGVLPLVGSLDWLARFFPWFYFNGSDPLNNGIDPVHVAVLVGSSLVLTGLAFIGFSRRDIRERSTGASLVDRLRNHALTRGLAGRLSGTARVSRIWVKTFSEHQAMLTVLSIIVLVFGIWMGPMYNQLDESLKTISRDLPEGVLALIGNVDMSTPTGWLTGELYSLVIPIVLITLAVAVGSRALGGEERKGTMSLLLACPVSRRRILGEKALAMVALTGLVGIFTVVGVALGSWLGGLGVGLGEIAGTTLLATLLGLVFGSLSLALGAASGRVPLAAYGAAGVAVVAYLTNSMLPLNDSLADFARLSPFYYFLTGDPLANGIDWGHAAVLAGLSGLLLVASAALFSRRDLR
jgi:ABC-2 type transport system permease protein